MPISDASGIVTTRSHWGSLFSSAFSPSHGPGYHPENGGRASSTSSSQDARGERREKRIRKSRRDGESARIRSREEYLIITANLNAWEETATGIKLHFIWFSILFYSTLSRFHLNNHVNNSLRRFSPHYLIPPSILNVEFNTPIYPKTARNPVNPPFLPKMCCILCQYHSTRTALQAMIWSYPPNSFVKICLCVSILIKQSDFIVICAVWKAFDWFLLGEKLGSSFTGRMTDWMLIISHYSMEIQFFFLQFAIEYIYSVNLYIIILKVNEPVAFRLQRLVWIKQTGWFTQSLFTWLPRCEINFTLHIFWNISEPKKMRDSTRKLCIVMQQHRDYAHNGLTDAHAHAQTDIRTPHKHAYNTYKQADIQYIVWLSYLTDRQPIIHSQPKRHLILLV